MSRSRPSLCREPRMKERTIFGDSFQVNGRGAVSTEARYSSSSRYFTSAGCLSTSPLVESVFGFGSAAAAGVFFAMDVPPGCSRSSKDGTVILPVGTKRKVGRSGFPRRLFLELIQVGVGRQTLEATPSWK